jgi:hypothetical protein
MLAVAGKNKSVELPVLKKYLLIEDASKQYSCVQMLPKLLLKISFNSNCRTLNLTHRFQEIIDLTLNCEYINAVQMLSDVAAACSLLAIYRCCCLLSWCCLLSVIEEECRLFTLV